MVKLETGASSDATTRWHCVKPTWSAKEDPAREWKSELGMEAFSVTVKGGLIKTGSPEYVTHTPFNWYALVIEYAVKTTEVLE